MNPEGFCPEDTIEPILNAGLQPVSNRYLHNRIDEEVMYPLIVGQDKKNGVISLITPFPPKELVPKFDWISYNEPEPHLDHTVDFLCRLEGVNEKSVVGGITFKDDSTLLRFARRGFKTWRLDIHDDLNIVEKGAGAESIQAALKAPKAHKITEKYGLADILIVRHIMEHVYDLLEFTSALKLLMSNDGYIVFEIPDCTRSLELSDYTMLWEEHLYYFTPFTLKIMLNIYGFELIRFENYDYPFENSMVAVTRIGDKQGVEIAEDKLRIELVRGKQYGKEFKEYRTKFKEIFTEYRQKNGKIALLGAGHLASMFIWLFQLQEYIECVIDDNPHKQGLFMPASRLPILSSHVLLEQNISLCLLGLNPMNEEKVILINQEFVKKGGKFLSIFPASPRAIQHSGLL
jgi:hypothetical protein